LYTPGVRIVFLGTPEFAIPSLEAVAGSPFAHLVHSVPIHSVADPLHGPSGHGPSAHVLGSKTVGLLTRIGNMYADEALFESRIHPLRPANSLSQAEIERLYHAIRKVLLKALASKGASVRNYIRPDGRPGTAHDDFNVAHGVGKNCPGCGGPIQRIVVRGRGTYLCPKCQPEP